jgi:hypothetical protein
MKKVVFVAVLLLGCCALAMAEEMPKAEAFAGYSYYRCNPEGISSSCNLNGWIGSFSLNQTKWFGAVAEFGGNYGSVDEADNVKVLSFLFGPRFYIRRNEKVTPFAHALVGDSYIHVKSGKIRYIKEHDLTLVFGGGLDLKINKVLAVRPFQVDYVMVRSKDSARMDNFRFSAGIVFRIGERGN